MIDLDLDLTMGLGFSHISIDDCRRDNGMSMDWRLRGGGVCILVDLLTGTEDVVATEARFIGGVDNFRVDLLGQ